MFLSQLATRFQLPKRRSTILHDQDSRSRWNPPCLPRLTLRPGTQLGGYEIVSALGAGGMGEVYRARDPRLNRQVAIKLLPSESICEALQGQPMPAGFCTVISNWPTSC